jgi:presenilin-like A22 family membrane protease
MRSLRALGLVALYVGAQIVALLLALPFKSAGFAATSGSSSPTAPLYLIGVIVLAPLGILFLARRGRGLSALRGLILLAIAGSLDFTLYATLSLAVPPPFLLPPAEVGQVGDVALVLAAVVSSSLFVALLLEPQWYIVDAAGFSAAGSLIALLGISFTILPTFILLAALAVYDAIAVYRTKHMVSLADVVTQLRLPILMVMPTGSGYDYTQAPSLAEQREEPVERREALFMGLGDVVVPGVLVVSAFVWLPATPVWGGVGGNLVVALAALVGSLVGYAALMRLVARGNPQAGLPFLNSGAIAGYVVAYLALFRSLSLGFLP